MSQSMDMENSITPEALAAKAKADREKFETIVKVETTPVILKGSRGRKKLLTPELKSPDENNPRWIRDPEEAIAERKASARAKKLNKNKE